MDNEAAPVGSESPATPTTESAPPAGGSEPKTTPNQADPAGQQAGQDGASGEPETGNQGENREGEEPRKSRAQRRIESLLAQNKELTRQRDYYKGLGSKAQPAKTLDPLDYPNDAAYTAALVRQTVDQTQSGFAERQAEEAARQAEHVAQQIWDTRVEDYKASVPDFEQVAFSKDVTYSDIGFALVKGMDNGPAIAYYLGKNPAEAQRLSGLNPVETAIEFGKLSQKLAMPQTRRVSAAPNPPTTLRGGQAPSAVSPQDMSMEQYNEWVKTRGKK